MCESASSPNHTQQREFVSAACRVMGSALTSLLALVASRESVKKNRNRTMSFGPKDASGLTRILSVSAVQEASRHSERTILRMFLGKWA